MGARARIAIVLFAVDDIARAARFYAAALGWTQTVDVPGVFAQVAPPSDGADTGEPVSLGLYSRSGFAQSAGAPPIPAPPPGSVAATELYVAVDDLDAAIAALLAAGATPLSPRAHRSWGDEAAYFRDPDGNVVAVAVVGEE